MLALLSVAHSFVFRAYVATFCADDEPVAPIDIDSARSLATPRPDLMRLNEDVSRMFHPGRLAMQRSIRLALRLKKGWLFADQTGVANYAGQPGTFDVVAWTQLLRRSSLHGLYQSTLTRIKIENRTSKTMTIRDGVGFVRGVVPPHTSRTSTSWSSPHRIWLGGKVVGQIDSSFQSIQSRGAQLNVFDEGQVQKGRGWLGSGPEYAVRLVASEHLK